MSEAISGSRARILALASVVEGGTGIALLAVPSTVARLLLGADVSGVPAVLGRCFGIALLALAVACWPGRTGGENGAAAVRAMFAYNALIALYLAYLAAAGHVAGPLSWPAVGLHAIVALLLAFLR